MNSNSIFVFYFPYREVGGVSVLFLRLAKILSNSYRVILMDFDDGYMARNLPANVDFISFDRPDLLPKKSVIITQSIPLWRIPKIKYFPLDAYIFYWNLHPDNLYPDLMYKKPFRRYLKWIVPLVNSLSFIRRKKLKKMLTILQYRQSIAFMDLENKSKTYGFFSKPLDTAPYLPIMTGYESSSLKNESPTDEIKCLWLGRLESFKMSILLHTIKRLDKCSQKLSLTIIGDGLSISIVKKHALMCKNVRCDFIGLVPFDELDDVISAHHIVFSMGTSALEGAKNKTPTFCLDYSYQEIQGLYKYKYLFEVNGYNVGENITNKHLELSSSLEVKIQEIVDNYTTISAKCYEYWRSNHSPDVIVSEFINQLSKSSCKLHELINLGLSNEDFFTRLVTKIHSPAGGLSGFISR
jgi:glycosyltransferase involved in cell wall biosynthesis